MPNRNRYTWTYYKYPKLYNDYLTKLSKLPNFAYTIGQVEECPDTKRLHIQGYTEFTESTPIATIRSVLKGISSKACSVSKGNQQHNITYCSKSSSQILPPIEIGVPLPKNQGKRNDIHATIALVENTNSMRDVLSQSTSYLSVRMAEKYLQYKEKQRKIAPINFIWIHGVTGVGKTRYVYENYTDVFRPINYKWWEGYDCHKTVLIDDFRKTFCNWDELLRLTDIYPFRVETKGGSRHVKFTTIIFTSPEPPKDLWGFTEDIDQLLRRITKTIHLKKSRSYITLDF